MLKYAHDFYLKSQNKKPKYCPVYIDNLKLLLKSKKNPFHNFKKKKPQKSNLSTITLS